jgi:NADH-quinone oxidoreductase subunit B
MEIGGDLGIGPAYDSLECDADEGQAINALRTVATEPIPDPDRWLEVDVKDLPRGVWVARLDAILDWGRRWSCWPMQFGLACCAMEMVAAAALRFDISRFGMELFRASPRQADMLIISGTLTWKMAPAVQMIYNQLAEPKWVVAMGSCAISGGPFADSYAVVPGINRILPVDVYVPGCPPRPESLYKGLIMLHEKISQDSMARS